MKSWKWLVEIEGDLDLSKGRYWGAVAFIDGVRVCMYGKDGFKTDDDAKADWEKFALKNGIDNWEYNEVEL